MISISENANKNYLAKVIQLKGLRKHENADRLQVAVIDFQNVITGIDAKDGDVCVFFPLECQINADFLAKTNSFRDKEMNDDKEKAGFFEKKCRVRAVKLRGEKSMGYIVPVGSISEWLNDPGIDWLGMVGMEFDTISEILMCKKYELPSKESNQNTKKGKKPRISRLVEGQVRLHVDTENLRKAAFKIKPEDSISITYKTHGTSFWVSNVLVKRKLAIIEKVLRFLGVKIEDTEYDTVFGSRKVVKNEYETQGTQDFYDGDLWGEIKDELKEFIPKGYTLYGEALGYTKSGAFIQQHYDYGCEIGKRRLQIYRITFTNADGIVNDLSSAQIKEFCEHFGLEYVHAFYLGKAKDLYPELDTENHWHEEFMKRLEADYNDKNCFMCKNEVPEEGIVIRKESLFAFEVYKLKSFKFLEFETALLDAGQSDMESDN